MWLTSRGTYVRSHSWIAIDVFVSATVVVIAHQIFLRLMPTQWWVLWIVLIGASYCVNTILLTIDADHKSIADLQRQKLLYRNDGFNLIRNASISTLFGLLTLASQYSRPSP